MQVNMSMEISFIPKLQEAKQEMICKSITKGGEWSFARWDHWFGLVYAQMNTVLTETEFLCLPCYLDFQGLAWVPTTELEHSRKWLHFRLHTSITHIYPYTNETLTNLTHFSSLHFHHSEQKNILSTNLHFGRRTAWNSDQRRLYVKDSPRACLSSWTSSISLHEEAHMILSYHNNLLADLTISLRVHFQPILHPAAKVKLSQEQSWTSYSS